MNVKKSGSISPFSGATVVVSDNYIDTFSHPDKLITYLQRQFLQLDLEIVSSDRPFTIKGSWRTIIKIDAFLRTLISTLLTSQNSSFAKAKGIVPTEAEFNAAFIQFEEENNYWNDTEDDAKAKHLNVIPENEVDKSPNYCTVVNINSQKRQTEQFLDTPLSLIPLSTLENDNSVSSKDATKETIIDRKPLDKWYFSTNLRGQTADKIHRRHANSYKLPPAPYVMVEAEGANKTNQPSIIEIEEVLCQVYKKETIEKYQKKLTSNASEKYDLSQEQSIDTKCSVKAEMDATDNSEESGDGIVSKSNLLISELQPNNQTVSQTTNSKLTQQNLVKQAMKKKVKSHSLHNIKSEPCVDNEIHEVFDESQFNERRRSLRQKIKKSNLLSGISAADNKEDTKETKGKKCDIGKLKRSVRSCSRKIMSERSLCKSNVCESVSHIEQDNSNKNMFETSSTNIKNQENSRLTEQESAKIIDEIQSKQTADIMVKRNVKSDLVYKCDNCGYETSKRMRLIEHKRRVHLTKKFTCKICSKDFGLSKDLRRHMKCHNKAEHCCDVCGKLYKDVKKLEEHKRVHSDNYVKPEFPCKFCSKSFSTKYVLAYHIKSNHLGMKRSYICPTCGKCFSQKNSYLQHANVHLGIRPYACEDCGKKFSYVKSLKEHMFMHKTDKLFPCKMCNKSFRQASGLAIHMKVHKATKDHVCSMCGKGFSQRQAMVRHERIHIGEKPFECLLCKRTFADSSVLRRHMILIHKKDPKMWQGHTVCHIQKKTDFFISILNDSSNTKTSEVCSPVGQDVVNEITNGLTEVVQHPSLPELTERVQQFYVPDQLSDLQRDAEHYVTVSLAPKPGDTGTEVKEEPVHSQAYESRALTEHYDSLTNHPNIQPQVLQAENHLPTINHISQLDTSVCPSSQLSLQNNLVSNQNHVPLTAQSLDSLSEQQLSNDLCSRSQNTAFFPIGYSQRQYSPSGLHSEELQHVQYATMISQPYTQTIVVLQDDLNITYHNPNVDVTMSDYPNPPGIHLPDINQSP